MLHLQKVRFAPAERSGAVADQHLRGDCAAVDRRQLDHARKNTRVSFRASSFPSVRIEICGCFQAMYDPINPDSDKNKMLNEVGKYFTLAFTAEMSVKV